MATLIANAGSTQNLTGAATFAAAEAGALAAVLNRNTTTAIAAATTVTSVTFTVTNLKVIDAVLLWVKVTAASPTGTFKVDLQKGGVSQASVTVNKADLPDSTNAIACPVLFKLSSNATGDGGANWTIVITTTGTQTVTINIASATTTNYTRALRTTTAATAAAGDDLYIVGELTGAGAHTSRTVTMNQTAATAYGNGAVNSITVSGGLCAVSCYGTLSYGTSASTNYLLRLAGDLIAYQFGTLNIGSSGSEIPRNSSAVLEFQPVSASGDFGLRCLDNSTVNIAGLSRTVGKNVAQCKMTADVTSSSVLTTLTPTTTNGTNNTLTALEASALSLFASAFTGNTTNGNHSVSFPGASITNTTQTATVWLARGSGTHNRFVRVYVGNATTLASVTNGFFAEVDMQAGTVGTVTAVGNGTATSVSITAVGSGFSIRMTGKCSSGAATPSILLVSESAAATTSFVGVADQSFIYDDFALVTASSISDTTYSVDTDTGWLSGDAVCVASTSRTASDSEIVRLNANAGASSIVTAGYPFGSGSNAVNGTHSGTTPTQGEIGLLTRNVKIRSTSTTLYAYVYATALATITFSWAEFYYLGVTSVAGKRGMEIDCGATANVKSVTYCSVHDVFNALFTVASSTSWNVTWSNNVVWNTSNVAVFVLAAITNTDWTFDSNLLMRLGSHGFDLLDVGGTITNNTVVGCGSATAAFAMSESSAAIIALGTFSNNTAHSGISGLSFTTGSYNGTIDNFKGWRNTTGVIISSTSTTVELIFNSLTLFGNTTLSGQFNFSAGDALIMTGTNLIAGDTTFSSPVGIGFATNNLILLDISGLDMSGSTSIYAPHTSSDLLFSAVTDLITPQGTMNNCKFGASTVIANRTSWTSRAYIGFEKYGQTAGDHRTEMPNGTLKTDSTISNFAAPSQRMTPNNASNKLESAPKGKGVLVAVANGTSVNIAAYVYKSKTGDGAAYNGNQPRLVQRANAALGQASDVVIATYGSGTGSWNQISGNSSTATDDGVWEFIIDCDGTAGWVNADDWQAA